MDRDHGAPGRLAHTKLNHPQPDRSPEPDGDGVRAGRPDPVGIALGSGIPVAFTRRVTSRRKAESAPESAWSAVGDDIGTNDAHRHRAASKTPRCNRCWRWCLCTNQVASSRRVPRWQFLQPAQWPPLIVLLIAGSDHASYCVLRAGCNRSCLCRRLRATEHRFLSLRVGRSGGRVRRGRPRQWQRAAPGLEHHPYRRPCPPPAPLCSHRLP